MRGGTKRKIPMEKIEKQNSRAVAFSKRRKGLYGKATELCLLSGSRIAILSTPVSSKSNASFYSFGHSSVDSVVSAFLENQPPRDDTELGFWWEDESLLESENLDELREALDSVSSLMNRVNDLKKKKRNQTLSLCIEKDLPVKNSEEEREEERILAICDNALPGDIQELEHYQIIDFETNSENQNLSSGYGSVEDRGALVMYRDSDQDHSHLSNLVNKETEVMSANLDECNQETDFENKNCESLLMNLSCDWDDLHFSDVFPTS